MAVGNEVLDRLAREVASMGKGEVKANILNFNGHFQLDFPEEYLESQSIDRLRHILLAAMLQKARRS